KDLDYFRNIAVPAGVALNFSGTNGSKRNGAFRRFREWRNLYNYLLERCRIFFQSYVDDCRLGVGDLDFEDRLILVSQVAHFEIIKPRFELVNFVKTVHIRSHTTFRSLQKEISKHDGVVVDRIRDPSFDDPALGICKSA